MVEIGVFVAILSFLLILFESVHLIEKNDPPFVCHYAAKLRSGSLDLPKKVTKWTFSSSLKYSTPRSSAVPI
jgi:hypothetical protein